MHQYILSLNSYFSNAFLRLFNLYHLVMIVFIKSKQTNKQTNKVIKTNKKDQPNFKTSARQTSAHSNIEKENVKYNTCVLVILAVNK